MISTIAGTLVSASVTGALVEVGGIGVKVLCPASSLADLPGAGSHVRLHTYLHVREDALTLYGFASADGRDVFETLIGVNGVGPKVALGILSAYSPDDLRKAVSAEDVEALTRIPGVGKKTAGRLVLELKEKLGSTELGPGATRVLTGAPEEVREALVSLGYSPAEARAALDGVESDGMKAEQLLKVALKRIGSR